MATKKTTPKDKTNKKVTSIKVTKTKVEAPTPKTKTEKVTKVVVPKKEPVAKKVKEVATTPKIEKNKQPRTKKEITPKVENSNVEHTKIYTDGSYFDKENAGGYGAYIPSTGTVVYGSASEPETSNNKMELTAVIEGLKNTPDKNVEIVSDSKYVTDAFNKNWLKNWKENGWKSSSGDVKNRELWEELDAEVSNKNDVKFTWTKAHADDNLNNLCDEVAKIAAKQSKV